MAGRERTRAQDGVGTESTPMQDDSQSICYTIPTRPQLPLSSGAQHSPSHVKLFAPVVQPTFRPLGLITNGAENPCADKSLDVGYLIPNAHPPRAAPRFPIANIQERCCHQESQLTWLSGMHELLMGLQKKFTVQLPHCIPPPHAPAFASQEPTARTAQWELSLRALSR